jgi:uncharacterized membrane protein
MTVPPDPAPDPAPDSALDRELEAASAGVGAEVDAIAAERLIFFSDAVVAIAMTLLALALPLPHGSKNQEILKSLWQRDHREAYIAFLISFLVIGGYWRVHHRMFRYVIRVDNRLISLNMAWLLMMVLTPFGARLLAGPGAFGVRFSFYALVQAGAALCLLLMNRELAGNQLLRAGTPESVTTGARLPLLANVIAFLVSIPVAFFTGWAYVVWAVIPLLFRIRKRIRSRRRRASPAD